MEKPFFSIIIPCYNQGNYLYDSVRSLLCQGIREWEAIIVNDGSSDHTEKIASEFSESDSRIRLINKENGGLSSARNAGIKASRGNWFIFLDADDFLNDNCLQEIHNAIVNEDAEKLARYGYSYVSKDARNVLHTVLPTNQREMLPSVFFNVPGPCHGICISRKMVEKTGFFDESLRALEDWDFWIRAGKAGGSFVNIPRRLVFYRQVSGSMSRDPVVMFDAAKTVIGRIPKKDNRLSGLNPENKDITLDTSPVLKSFFMRMLGVMILQGDLPKSVSCFQSETKANSFKYAPSDFSEMCSSLSFRYVRGKNEIAEITENQIPAFRQFFCLAGFDTDFTRRAVFFIFGQVLMKKNRLRFGSILSKIPNYFLRLKFNQQ